MKTFLLNLSKNITLLVFVVIQIGIGSAIAQNDEMPKDLYYEIACFKAKNPNAVNYFKTTAHAIHKEMEKQKIIENWSFFKVDFPNGNACECDFRAIRMFRGMEALEKLKDPAVREQIIKNIWPNKTKDDISQEFASNFDFQYSQVFNMIDALIPEATSSKLVVVNFMDVKPENRSTYVEMESEIFKPLHKVNNESGKIVDWVLARRVIPYGAEIKTDYITMDKYESYADMQNSGFMEMFTKVHPTKDGKATMTKMSKMRKLAKSEIWKHIVTD